MGAEAPQRDDKVSELRPHPVDIYRIRRLQRPVVQGTRSLTDEAYDAGEREGYALGYVDGYDAGEEVTLCRMRKKLEEIERGEL
jgi:hypothetical protein